MVFGPVRAALKSRGSGLAALRRLLVAAELGFDERGAASSGLTRGVLERLAAGMGHTQCLRVVLTEVVGRGPRHGGPVRRVADARSRPRFHNCRLVRGLRIHNIARCALDES